MELTIIFRLATGLLTTGLSKLKNNDAYFVCGFSPDVVYKSFVVTSSTPTYDEEWSLANVPENSILSCTFWDKNSFSEDTKLGTFSHSVSQSEQVQIPIQAASSSTTKQKSGGSIEVTFYANPDVGSGPMRSLGPIRHRRVQHSAIGLFSGKKNTPFVVYKLWLLDLDRWFKHQRVHYKTTKKGVKRIFENKFYRGMVKGIHSNLYTKSVGASHNTLNHLMYPHEPTVRSYGGTGGALAYLMKLDPSKKPDVYTFVIHSDGTFRFSETSIKKKVPLWASKHGIHSNMALDIAYAGEFMIVSNDLVNNVQAITPNYRYNAQYSSGWTMVLDNQSGTYEPPVQGLDNLMGLFSANFPDLNIETLSFDDPRRNEWRRLIGYQAQLSSSGNQQQNHHHRI